MKYVSATGATLDKGREGARGRQTAVQNQKGETVYPLFYANSIYLPLREASVS